MQHKKLVGSSWFSSAVEYGIASVALSKFHATFESSCASLSLCLPKYEENMARSMSLYSSAVPFVQEPNKMAYSTITFLLIPLYIVQFIA